MKLARLFMLAAAAATLVACGEGSWFGSARKDPIPGERIPVLPQNEGVIADARIASVSVQLPPETDNRDWPQPAGYVGEFIANPAVKGFDIAWRTSIGSGNSRDGRISAAPIVASGRVYAIDADERLSAIDAATGKSIWRVDLTPDDDRSGGGSGGGAAYFEGRLYVATGYAQVICVDPENGKEIWRTTLTGPFRSGPAVDNGRVFAVSSDNQIHALDIATGRKLWTHSGLAEGAGIYGGAAPVVAGNMLIAGLSSGELFALRVDNGRVLWSDSLAGIQKSDAVSALPDVRGFPVVDHGQVIAAGHASRLVDIDLRSGARIWEQDLGSFNSPWVAGDFLYMITDDDNLLCVSRRDGRIRWTRQLHHYDDEKKKTGVITWVGPIVAGGRLFAANTAGEAIVASPESGEILSNINLPGGVSVLPVVASGTVYVLTDDAELVALR
ncbi:MAG TPA: PQQ-binding-like beta-propeller repeat protein [Alphaproteobacteria bacterium]|nr:PQQ-binding-like beta-propeller repeat protein [Alphaproteobacteria bacterium]